MAAFLILCARLEAGEVKKIEPRLGQPATLSQPYVGSLPALAPTLIMPPSPGRSDPAASAKKLAAIRATAAEALKQQAAAARELLEPGAEPSKTEAASAAAARMFENGPAALSSVPGAQVMAPVQTLDPVAMEIKQAWATTALFPGSKLQVSHQAYLAGIAKEVTEKTIAFQLRRGNKPEAEALKSGRITIQFARDRSDISDDDTLMEFSPGRIALSPNVAGVAPEILAVTAGDHELVHAADETHLPGRAPLVTGSITIEHKVGAITEYEAHKAETLSMIAFLIERGIDLSDRDAAFEQIMERWGPPSAVYIDDAILSDYWEGKTHYGFLTRDAHYGRYFRGGHKPPKAGSPPQVLIHDDLRVLHSLKELHETLERYAQALNEEELTHRRSELMARGDAQAKAGVDRLDAHLYNLRRRNAYVEHRLDIVEEALNRLTLLRHAVEEGLLWAERDLELLGAGMSDELRELLESHNLVRRQQARIARLQKQRARLPDLEGYFFPRRPPTNAGGR